MEAKISAIARHRIGVDGDGVTTLVVSMLCPLNCKYCLNPQTLSLSSPHSNYTAQQLYDELKIDNLYFLATGGGITFGGGEPLLNAEFIKEFRSICGEEWKINVETSLNVPQDLLKTAIGAVDSFIVDIKDMDPDTYSSYTGKDNSRVRENLEYLAKAGRAGSCKIRVPLIPGFNREADQEASVAVLKAMGFTQFDRFEYRTAIHGKRKRDL